MASSMPLLDCSLELKALSRSKVRWASAMSLAGKPQPGRTGQQVNNVVRCSFPSPQHRNFIQTMPTPRSSSLHMAL